MWSHSRALSHAIEIKLFQRRGKFRNVTSFPCLDWGRISGKVRTRMTYEKHIGLAAEEARCLPIEQADAIHNRGGDVTR